MLNFEITYCTYTSPNGTVHKFWGYDCWERAEAFKARYEEPTDG